MMKALRRSLALFGAVLACGLGAAQAEVRIMMRTAPGAAIDQPADQAEPLPSLAPAAPEPAAAAAPAPPPAAAVAAPDMPLRRGEGEPAVSETAEGLTGSPPVRRARERDVARPAPQPAPVSPDELPPQDRRAASLYGAAAPAPVSAAGGRRRAQSPDEFRERCTTDGGLMQGGGKYGLCIIR
jgi:translation initiation factor IF-2